MSRRGAPDGNGAAATSETLDLDRLELELRSLSGVVAVALGRDVDGLRIQAIVVETASPGELRARIRRIVTASVHEPAALEIVVTDPGSVVEP